MIEKIREWFRRPEVIAREEAEGERPVATPPAGVAGDRERETSTNAQTAGSRDEPWSGNG
jgi:hypothetical protein